MVMPSAKFENAADFHLMRDQMIASALSALRLGNVALADQTLGQLTDTYPDDAAVDQLAAVIALTKGDGAAALKQAESSLQKRPHHPPTLLIAGRAARLLGNLTLADAQFSLALQIEPGRAETAFMTCITRLELGDTRARPMLDQLIAHFPEDAGGWFEMGLSLQKAGKLDAALSAFERAHRHPESHLRRATILRLQQQREPAIAAYLSALEHNNGLVEAWFHLGILYQEAKQPAAAIEAYRQVLTRRPDLVEAEVNLGLLLQEKGDLEAAYASYRLALKLRPESFSRIAQGITAAPHGELWLNLDALRQHLLKS